MSKYFITYVIYNKTDPSIRDVLDYAFSDGDDIEDAIQKFCDSYPDKIDKMYVCALDDVYKPLMEMYYGRNDNNR